MLRKKNIFWEWDGEAALTTLTARRYFQTLREIDDSESSEK